MINTQRRRYPLNSIYFYLTEGCNLACRHCWIQPKFQDGVKVYPSLEFEVFKHIIEQAMPLGLKTAKLTGGEPFLHPRIYELIRFVRQKELRLVIETNGVLCTSELAKEIVKNRPRNPFVSVSMDAPDKEIHEHIRGVKGSFDAAVKGIKNLVAVGMRPQMIMSIMRCNKHLMEEFVYFAQKLGAGSVKFNIVQPTARGEAMHKTNETLTIKELVETGKWVDRELSKKVKIRLFYSHPCAFKSFSDMFGAKGLGICGIFGILGVLGNADYALCGIGETVPELVFGNAKKDILKYVWENAPMLQQIRVGLPKRLEGICADCVMRERCLGSCIAQNYYRKKNLWAPFWFCEEAHEKGLFPKTRLRPMSAKA